MMIDLRGRMLVLDKRLKQGVTPLGWEERYKVYPGESPWWEIIEPNERRKVLRRQSMRMWRKTHPGVALERMKQYSAEHPERIMEIRRKSISTHVYTSKGPDGRVSLPAFYKRIKPNVCELCSQAQVLHWHHWTNSNASAGLWVDPHCDCFCEVIDTYGQELPRKYVTYRELLDDEYADGIIVERAKLNNRTSFLSTRINGIVGNYLAYGKRECPKDNMCELCGVIKCKDYHHWDSSILGKGLWLCFGCHWFAERFDEHGEAFAKKYLALKEQDEHRVLALMNASSVRTTPDMFPSIGLNGFYDLCRKDLARSYR